MERPKITEFMGDGFTLNKAHEQYLNNLELWNYTQALDEYASNLEDSLAKDGEELTYLHLEIKELRDKLNKQQTTFKDYAGIEQKAFKAYNEMVDKFNALKKTYEKDNKFLQIMINLSPETEKKALELIDQFGLTKALHKSKEYKKKQQVKNWKNCPHCGLENTCGKLITGEWFCWNCGKKCK